MNLTDHLYTLEIEVELNMGLDGIATPTSKKTTTIVRAGLREIFLLHKAKHAHLDGVPQ